jgi:flavin reductase (DIM6/NTAB) family NADH-FMN oxidoreductase RutF
LEAERENRIDPKALFNLSYGMYLIGSVKEGRYNGQIANAAMQVTGDPCAIAICLHKSNLTCEYVGASGLFSLSVLEQEVPMTFIGAFGFKSGRDVDKFCDVNCIVGDSGVPMVTKHALSVIEARVVERLDVFTHTLFVGQVLSSRVIREGSPLTYSDYHLVKKGRSPKTAPTFAFNDLNKKG